MADLQKTLKTIPERPGIYIYKNSSKEIIYIGKAVNLAKRVKQYFQRDDAVGDKTPLLVSEIATIDTIETDSEFDALLLEAKLIKEFQPKYNVIAKDDKSPLYIIFRFDHELPTISFGRKPKQTISPGDTHAIAVQQSALLDQTNKKYVQFVKDEGQHIGEDTEIYYFGPFQSAKTARNLMRSLRRVVPYCTQKQRTGKKCFYTHLGLCDPCPSYISKCENSPEQKLLTKVYRQHIFRLRDILLGKSVEVVSEMEKEMTIFSDQHQYEQAASLRNQLDALRALFSKRYDPSVYVQSDTLIQELKDEELQELIGTLKPYYPNLHAIERIECYDISNIMGTHATASMVVLTHGIVDKQEYKKFKIRTLNTPNDFAMMQEVIGRRITHPEWTKPNLIVIDGGKGQVHAAQKAIEEDNSNEFANIPIIGLAKRFEEIIVPFHGDWKTIRIPYNSGALKLLQKIRDEAHRFAITYHKLLRSKSQKIH